MRSALLPIAAWLGALPGGDDGGVRPGRAQARPARNGTGFTMKVLLLLKGAALAALTPLLEKNVIKTLALDVPLVFSMGRVIVLAFALGMLRHIWHAGVVGWPDATLSMAIVLALPVFSALDRVAPERVVDLAQALVARFGIGHPAAAYAPSATEPSKFDDHRRDAL